MHDLSPSQFFSFEGFPHRSLFEGCRFPWEALGCISDFLLLRSEGFAEALIAPEAYLINPETITIGAGTVVEPGAYIEGPCWIGANCSIRHGAYLRGNVITGDDCVIGHCTEIKNTILLNRAKSAHFGYLGDSILGSDVNLGAGTRLANLRLDGKEIVLRVGGEWVPTGRRKFGAILGDGTQTGCNSVCNPGTVAAPGTLVMPCSCKSGLIGRFSGVKS